MDETVKSVCVAFLRLGSRVVHLGELWEIEKIEDMLGDSSKSIVTFKNGRSAEYCKRHSVQGIV
jgi:hypothetical protein